MSITTSGAFEIRAADRPCTIGSTKTQAFQFWYGTTMLAERMLPLGTSYIEVFDDVRADFELRMRETHWPQRVYLVDSETDEAVAHVDTDSMCGMTAGMINASSKYWLRSADGLFSRDVTLQEWGQIVEGNQAPALAWIAGLLPDDTLTTDVSAWRAPTSWQLRHVVGQGSFTGVSVSYAAALCGTSPQNFRRYTAHDGAKTQQQIGFAMWHLLLHRLGIQNLR